MNWKDSVKATALAVLADRMPAPTRIVADAPYRWNAYDVWLSRARPPRGLTPTCTAGEQATPTQQRPLRT